ncbi:Right origin-binding protein [compost metagenome]
MNNNSELVRQSIQYIEERLGEELTLKEVAQAMHYSEYHFHRTFVYWIGDTVTSYIRKRRLSRAAEALVYSEQKIVDIALQYGFGSHESFTRCFRKMYGMMPSACRKLGHPPFLVPIAQPKEMLVGLQNDEWSVRQMEARIEQYHAMRVIGYSITTAASEGNNTEIPAFWQKYMKEQLAYKIPGKLRPDVELGICSSMNTDGSFQYTIGFEVDRNTPVPEGMVELEVPETTYAIFTTPPAGESDFVSSIQSTWDNIYTNWFPTSGYEQIAAPDFEWYDKRCWSQEDKQIDIYIPVQPVNVNAQR